jgi:hypothetical protein
MKMPLELPPGIANDDTGFAVARWADGDNVRPWMGKMQTIGGWTDALSGDTLTGVCRNILGLGKNSGGVIMAFGTHSALQVFQAGVLYDITPVGLAAGQINSGGSAGGWGRGTWSSGTWSGSTGTYYVRTWALSSYGAYLIANPRGGTIFEWQGNTASPAAAITNAPTSVTYALATPQRQVLAFGCNEEVSTTFNALCIRGSDIEDNTDWTTTATNNAFEHILDAGSGRIVAARIIGPYVAVWTDLCLFLGEFLGDPQQTYRFDRVGENCGLAGPNAVEVVDSTAFWLAPDYQFRTWSIGGRVELVTPPIGKEFRDNIERLQVDKVAASALSQFGEVWWHYPDSRDGIENSRYLAVSMQDGAWFKGTMARTASINAGVLQYPTKATYGGMVYFHEYGRSADGSALAWSLTTSDIYIGTAESWAMCRGIWPDFEAQEGSVSLTASLKPYPQATARSKGPYTLAVNANKKDFLIQGRTASFIFSGSAVGTFMRIGKPTLDVVLTGQQ